MKCYYSKQITKGLIRGELNLQDISKAMAQIDICFMSTRMPQGMLETRPISNNRDVEYKGDCFFFANEEASAVQALKQDREEMKTHWVKDLDK